MKNKGFYLEMIRLVRSIVCSEEYLCRSSQRQMDFSRKRKMSFTDYIYAIIQNNKSSLQAGINAFIDTHKKGEIEYSKQAFSKGRQRIKPEAFWELSQKVIEKFYEKAELSNWNGYQLFGIDGSRLNLPCTEELREIYGMQITSGAPQVQALVSCVYDLLNGFIVDTCFMPCSSNERVAAREMIASFQLENVNAPVFVMDRGYPSAELIDSVIKSGHKFIMRASTEFLRKMKLVEDDNVIEHRFAKLTYPLKIRVLKIELSEVETEYLITNIFDSALSPEDFKQVYRKRWGIESKYNDLKNKLEIECFSGYSSIAILQDFYATVFLANLVAVLEYDLCDEIKKAHDKPENLYEYKINTVIAISELKRSVIEMLMTPSAKKRDVMLAKIAIRLRKSVVPVRNNRHAERKVAHKSMKFPQNMRRV